MRRRPSTPLRDGKSHRIECVYTCKPVLSPRLSIEICFHGRQSDDPSRFDSGARAAARCEVLAELMGGKCFPFGPLEGAFMAASGDANGTMIEVYPERHCARHSCQRRSGRVRLKTRRRRALGRFSSCCRCRWRPRRSSESVLARNGERRPSVAANTVRSRLPRDRVLAGKPADGRGRAHRRWPRNTWIS